MLPLKHMPTFPHKHPPYSDSNSCTNCRPLTVIRYSLTVSYSQLFSCYTTSFRLWRWEIVLLRRLALTQSYLVYERQPQKTWAAYQYIYRATNGWGLYACMYVCVEEVCVCPWEHPSQRCQRYLPRPERKSERQGKCKTEMDGERGWEGERGGGET